MISKTSLFLLLALFSVSKADKKCEICLEVVESIQETNYLESMANLSTNQIRTFINQQVKSKCHGLPECKSIARTLIVNAEQLDFDVSFTPKVLCAFARLCSS
ncbi:unnamed protein product [Caenorhabditis angaria]|uniref:Saposin B-type domain-containing protein n=1 Tax=Caenorhabditis angaria TaxID=860376 RepID=A0A9P1IUV9_9PELO|nr:unnamed protein product [Caenorhabditis angaria]